MRLLLAGQPGYMRAKGMDVVLVSGEGADWKGIPDLDAYEVHKVDMARDIALGRDIRALWALIRLFRRIRPDIVHSHTPKAGLLSMLAARVAQVPVRLHTVAGLPLMERRGWKRLVLVWAERLTYRCATGVYPNSLRLREYILEEGFTTPGKLKVIGRGSSNGIDTNFFKPSEELREAGRRLRAGWGIGEKDLVFLFIGRLVKDKGVEELVRAFTLLAARRTGIWLVLVGPYEDDLDPLSADTRRQIDEHPVIRTSGFAQDVRPYLCASDLLVFPSYREGFPNVPMQAGCFGLPCIVTNINGCNEIIVPEVNGLIVPPKDSTALEQAMERMVGDRELMTRCGGSARSMIETHYRNEFIWETLYTEYVSLLRQP